MRVVAIGLAKNEADVIGESVRECLRWADGFVIYDGSTDGTAELAEAAGAVVVRGPTDEVFNEGMRQRALEKAVELGADWVWRVDPDEIYHAVPNPRQVLEEAEKAWCMCVRAQVMEFWITLDDVRRGLLLEDEGVSVQKRRRWYTAGCTAMVAWRHTDDVMYSYDVKVQRRRNVPVTTNGIDVSGLGPCYARQPVQRHYPCRSWRQLYERVLDRSRDLNSFGKYRHNLIVDERAVGLHYLGLDEVFSFEHNYRRIYEWYEASEQLFERRMGVGSRE